MTDILQNSFERKIDRDIIEDRELGSDVYPYLAYKSRSEKEQLENVVSMLRETKLGKELVDDAEKHQTVIMLESLSAAHGSYDDEKNLVCLQSIAGIDRQITTAAHELRHAQQFNNGVTMNAFTDIPKDYLHSQWTIEADANVASCLVAWEYMQQGNPKPMEMYSVENGNISKPFLEAAQKGGIEDGSAHRAAFFAWFKDMGLRDAYESNYVRNYNRRKSKARMSDLKTALRREVPIAQNVDKMCTREDGRHYLTGKEAEAFFKQPEMNSVGHETFWAIYRALRDTGHFDMAANSNEEMRKRNYAVRESYYELSRDQTSEKRLKETMPRISLTKLPKTEKQEFSPIFTAALAKKAKGAGK